jgi:hypothetical protein
VIGWERPVRGFGEAEEVETGVSPSDKMSKRMFVPPAEAPTATPEYYTIVSIPQGTSTAPKNNLDRHVLSLAKGENKVLKL